MNSLRPYQTNYLNAVLDAYRHGFSRPCIVLPCGGGKSVIAAEMARRATRKGNRVLYLIHRKELKDQIEQTFASWDVDMDLCFVGMVQTVTRRLDRLRAPGLIITDENHHCLAVGYKRIYEAFPDAKCVGVTATPVRLNGGGLGDVNDKLIELVDAKWLIKNGYLAPYQYYAPSGLDLAGIKTVSGDYSAKQVEQRMTGAHTIFGDVIENYKSLSGGKAICYCPTIALSKRFADTFCAAGIPAAHIDGETPGAVRDALIAEFRTGRIKVLCNVDLISEGFDVPDCSCSILLRPTKSLTLYIQQSMRCMRVDRSNPEKTAVIIDHVGNYLRHGLPDDRREWTLDAKKKKAPNAGQMVTVCEDCLRCFPKALPRCPYCGWEVPHMERKVVYEERREAALKEITGFTVQYLKSPNDCKSYDELLAYAREKGYKPGWAYYQAKSRRLIG